MQQQVKVIFADGTLQIHVITTAEERADPRVLDIDGEDEEGNEGCLDADSLP
jgi:hypothetical protein